MSEPETGHPQMTPRGEGGEALAYTLNPTRYEIVGPGTGRYNWTVSIETRGAQEQWGWPESWAVYDGFACLTKRGDWIREMQPSSRTQQFLKRVRYATKEEALESFRRSMVKLAKSGERTTNFIDYDALDRAFRRKDGPA